ncbi:MAG: hypothetical protein JWO43_369 [Candidatus Adlerbacteria bacterium]|nr:hypothetical protein [Candidatus Adlerbacteria bacterium]
MAKRVRKPNVQKVETAREFVRGYKKLHGVSVDATAGRPRKITNIVDTLVTCSDYEAVLNNCKSHLVEENMSPHAFEELMRHRHTN